MQQKLDTEMVLGCCINIFITNYTSTILSALWFLGCYGDTVNLMIGLSCLIYVLNQLNSLSNKSQHKCLFHEHTNTFLDFFAVELAFVLKLTQKKRIKFPLFLCSESLSIKHYVVFITEQTRVGECTLIRE